MGPHHSHHDYYHTECKRHGNLPMHHHTRDGNGTWFEPDNRLRDAVNRFIDMADKEMVRRFEYEEDYATAIYDTFTSQEFHRLEELTGRSDMPGECFYFESEGKYLVADQVERGCYQVIASTSTKERAQRLVTALNGKS